MTNIQHVVVVGGGTAGWLTAAYVSKTVGRTRGVKVTLVESPDIGVIGVGEATIPTMRQTLRDLDIPEDEFLRGVNGSFKQAIRFQNWLQDPAEKSSYFYHPFHKKGDREYYGAAQFVGLTPDAAPETFARLYTPQTMACDAGLAPKPAAQRFDPMAGDLTYAYHMDAVLFGRFLRSRFEGNGVTRLERKIVSAEKSAAGDITALVVDDGSRIAGDFFVDCSGFRSLLLGQTLGEEFESFTRWLPCDTALAVSVPYREGEKIPPYTRSTAQKAGWVWDISLASRRGVGHVFSAAHMTDAEAEGVLAEYLGGLPKGADVRKISMRVGRSRRLWARNCVGVGLAGGFIEPLESTGIHLIEIGARFLVDNWPEDVADPAPAWNYNRLMHDAYDEVLRFVLMHYVVSGRRDTAFWRDVTATRPLPGDLDHLLSCWRTKFPTIHDVRTLTGNVFGYESYMAILAGNRWFQGVRSPYVAAGMDELRAYMKAQLLDYEKTVAPLPPLADYLAACGLGRPVTVSG